MKILIVYHSEHHQNTEKIAKVMAAKADADITKAEDANSVNISDYDIVGFGSGVYNGRLHSELFEIVSDLSFQNDKKSFLFSTTGSMSYSKLAHDRFRPLLINKGFKVIGEFSCPGFDTALTSAGINKGKPDKQDLRNAENFILSILNK